MKSKENEKCNTKAGGRRKKMLVNSTSQKEELNTEDNTSKKEKKKPSKRQKAKNKKTSEKVIKKSADSLHANEKDTNVHEKDCKNEYENEVLQSPTEKQIDKLNREETFFGSGQTKVICNSTAMSAHSQAYKRQINYPIEEVTINEISKIKDRTKHTYEDSSGDYVNTNRVKKSTKKVDQSSENSKSLEPSTENNFHEEDTIKRVQKTTRKIKKSINNTKLSSTDSESSSKDNTVIFLKPANKLKNLKVTKELKTNVTKTSLQQQQSSKNNSQQAKTSTNAKSNVSLIANSSKNSGVTKIAESSTVTSTTIRSPDAFSPLVPSYVNDISKTILQDSGDDDALVTSTTNIELPTLPADMLENIKGDSQPTTSHQAHNELLAKASQHSAKGILIYSPYNPNLAPAQNITSDGYFTITREHLSHVIGEKQADKFLKYYIGRKRFNSNSSIYYRPPTIGAHSDNMSSSSDSDDVLENLGQYGDLYESLNKSKDII